MSDDWCGICGSQMVELTSCLHCGDMFCCDCLELFNGCCSAECEGVLTDGDIADEEPEEPWICCPECHGELDGDDFCSVCGDYPELDEYVDETGGEAHKHG